MNKSPGIFALIALAAPLSVAGCGQKADTPPPVQTPQQQMQKVQNDPNMPPQVKAMQMRQIQANSGPPVKPQAQPGSTQ